MKTQYFTGMIEPLIKPDRARDEIGAFNPTACYDETGKLQVVYRCADSSRVTRLARAVADGERVALRNPLALHIATGDAEADRFVSAALANSEEDPRFVRLPGEQGWSMTVVGLKLPAYSRGQKAVTVLGKVSDDFSRIEITRLLTPDDSDDRHVIPFPEMLDGHYGLLTRPQKPGPESYVDYYTGQPSSVYLALTDDLAVRSHPKRLLSPRQPWEARRIGGVGPQPVRTTRGWLVVYMAIGMDNHYSVGAALLDPATWTVTARTPSPLLSPDEAFNRRYAVTDFGMNNVIFATTALVDERKDTVTFLAGCNDIQVGQVVIPFSEIVAAMDSI